MKSEVLTSIPISVIERETWKFFNRPESTNTFLESCIFGYSGCKSKITDRESAEFPNCKDCAYFENTAGVIKNYIYSNNILSFPLLNISIDFPEIENSQYSKIALAYLSISTGKAAGKVKWTDLLIVQGSFIKRFQPEQVIARNRIISGAEYAKIACLKAEEYWGSAYMFLNLEPYKNKSERMSNIIQYISNISKRIRESGSNLN